MSKKPNFNNIDRHSFWGNPSDAGINAMRAVFLGIQAMTIKASGLSKMLKGDNIRSEVRESCDNFVNALTVLMLRDNLLYKIMHAHSKQRIKRLNAQLKASRRRSQSLTPQDSIASDDEAVIPQVTVQNLETDQYNEEVKPDVFEGEEVESAKAFLAYYFDLDPATIPKKDLTPEGIVRLIKFTNSEETMMASSHGSFSRYVIKKMLEKHGLSDVEKRFNSSKYGVSSRNLRAAAAKDKESTSMQVLLDTLPLIFEVMLSTQEHDQELMDVSKELDRFAGKADGNTVESIENQHGQIDKNIRDIFIQIAMKSDDRELVAAIFEFFCLKAAVDHEKQITKMGTLQSAVKSSHAFYAPKIEALMKEKEELLRKLEVYSSFDGDSKKALDQVVTLSIKVDKLVAQLEEAKQTTQKQTEQIGELQETVQEQDAALTQKDRQIAELTKQLREAQEKAQSAAKSVGGRELPICTHKYPAKVQEVLSGVVVAVGASIAAGGISLLIPQVATMMMGGAVNANPLAIILVIAGVAVCGFASLGVQQARVKNHEWKLNKQQELVQVSKTSPAADKV